MCYGCHEISQCSREHWLMDTNEVVVAVTRDEPLRRSKEEVKGRLVFGGH